MNHPTFYNMVGASSTDVSFIEPIHVILGLGIDKTIERLEFPAHKTTDFALMIELPSGYLT